MIELNIETISIILACGSVIVGVASIVSKNRRDVDTRKANLYMSLNRWGFSQQYMKYLIEVNFKEKWRTWAEYEDRYGLGEDPEEEAKVYEVMGFCQTLGILVNEGMLDPKLIFRHFGPNIIMIWQRLEPIITGWEKTYGYSAYHDFKNLFNVMNDLLNKELKGKPAKHVIESLKEEEKFIQKYREEKQKDQ